MQKKQFMGFARLKQYHYKGKNCDFEMILISRYSQEMLNCQQSNLNVSLDLEYEILPYFLAI